VAAMLAQRRNNSSTTKSTPETKQSTSTSKFGGKKRSGGKISALAGKLNFGPGGVSPFGRGRPMMMSPKSTPPSGGIPRIGQHRRMRSKSTSGAAGATTSSSPTDMVHQTMSRPTLPKRRAPTPKSKNKSRRPMSTRVTKADMLAQMKS
tara:strand:+ start:235 stop:681 length:447 start_codon:yes stop_codon:yes gene_type:complete